MIAFTRLAAAATLLATLALAAPPLAALAQESARPAGSAVRDKETIDRLIEQLGDNEFTARERAQRELANYGLEALEALKAAIMHPDIEIAARARYLVGSIREDWGRPSDPEEVRKLLEGFGQLNMTERLKRINHLQALADDQGVSALCRIARFGETAIVAKRAALAVIDDADKDIDWNARGKTILDAVGASDAPSAEWLRLEVRSRRDPPSAADAWGQAVAAEEAVLTRKPQNSQQDIVVALLQRQAKLLEQLSRLPEAEAALVRTLEFDETATGTLTDVMSWLVKHRRWDRLDELSTRYAERFQEQPEAMYLLADALRKQGDEEKAEATASKALGFNPEEPLKHWQVAVRLQQRNWLSWAEAEYRRTIEIGPAATLVTFAAQSSLSELLHDQERHQAAAETLGAAVAELEKNRELRQLVLQQLQRQIRSVKSRLQYFHACHWKSQGDIAKQIEHLDKAIEADASDADVLIALYRLPDQDEARRKKTLAQIETAVNLFRLQIQATPDDATAYNQFAWLVGNTTGDQAEALRYSKKSLELRPDAAGFMDTLARCYYASGELEKAIEQQEKAVALEPGSGAMQRQLEFFRQEQARQKTPSDAR